MKNMMKTKNVESDTDNSFADRDEIVSVQNGNNAEVEERKNDFAERKKRKDIEKGVRDKNAISE